MAKAKPKPKTPFTGRWRIVSMSAWADDYLDEEVEAFIEFEEKGFGSFQFGYIQAEIDHRTTNRDGKPAVEFSFEGYDHGGGEEMSGRGWAILGADELHGMIFFHGGDDSEFVAKRAEAPTTAKRKKRADEP